MITPAEVMALPKGHAFALLHGGTLHKLRLPLPDDCGEAGLPRDLEAIAADLEQRYATAEGWHRHHEPWWGVGAASGAADVVGAVADTADLGPAAPVAGLSPAVAEAVADDPPDAEAVGLADVSLTDVSLTEAGLED